MQTMMRKHMEWLTCPPVPLPQINTRCYSCITIQHAIYMNLNVLDEVISSHCATVCHVLLAADSESVLSVLSMLMPF